MVENSEMDLRKLEWGTPSDWSQLIPTAASYTGRPRLCKEDILRFLDYKIHEIARDSGLPFEEARRIIAEENSAFLSYVDAIFSGEQLYKIDSDCIVNIRKLLILPSVKATVGRVLRMYNRLSTIKQEEFRKLLASERVT